MPARLPRWGVLLLAVVLFLMVWGVKLAVIARFGSDMPMWDQWDAEGEQILRPYLEHHLEVQNFFAPHNEHRVACTRALAFGLFLLNGQWDARLECVVNAALHAAIAAAIFLYGCAGLTRNRVLVWLVAVAALTAPPLAWQNVISGFHSQQYLLIGFSLGALALLLHANPGTPRWWGGLACAGLALFCMASGLLAAATAALVLAVSGRPREVWRRHAGAIVACLVVVAGGWLLQVNVSQNAGMRAHSPLDFAIACWRNLQWPATAFAPLALLLWLPWAGLAWRVCRRPGRADARSRVTFATGLWVLLQFAATAYGRGAGGLGPASRYLDTAALGVLVNALALLQVPAPARAHGWRRGLNAALVVGWTATVGPGLWFQLQRIVRHELPAVTADLRQAEFDTRAYLATGDETYLDHPIPYPDKHTLIDRLNSDELRAALPASIRLPLALTGQAEPAGSFALRGLAPGTPAADPLDAWGSYTGAGAAAEGTWRSEPLPGAARAGYWEFQVAGDIGRRPGLSLRLVAAGDDAALASLAPPSTTRRAWRAIYVPAPRQAVRLVARDASATGWFGFGAPVEVGPLSYWAMRLAALGLVIATVAGVVAALLIILFGWLPAPAPAPPAGATADGAAGE